MAGIRTNVVHQPHDPPSPRRDEAISLLAQEALLPDEVRTRFVTVAGTAYTATQDDHTILVDTTAGAYTLTIPNPAFVPGREYVIKKIATANAITITPAAGSIDKLATHVFGAGTFDSRNVVSDGVDWWIT
jgi:hypothetical protein